jgi:heme oxygenase (biliverdin-producing, ferredoxin)
MSGAGTSDPGKSDAREFRSLAAKLRHGTAELHAIAESSGIMSELINGQVDSASYTALLRNYYEIYDALETALLAHAGHWYIAPLVQPQWFRLGRLSADLDLLHEGPWHKVLPVMPATRSYRDRIESLREQEPELLVAHTYVRYLGDLHGGQRLRSIVARGLQLTAPNGTRFYDFDGPLSVPEHILRFRSALDSVQYSAAQVDRIVAEAQDSFRRHAQMFEQIGAWRASLPIA